METVEKIQAKLNEMTDSDWMGMKTMDSPFHYSLMQFYNRVCHLSYFVSQQMSIWFACRLVELSLEHGFYKYLALGIMKYAMVLGGKVIHNVQATCKVGKMALKLLGRFDASGLLPGVYMVSQSLTTPHSVFMLEHLSINVISNFCFAWHLQVLLWIHCSAYRALSILCRHVEARF